MNKKCAVEYNSIASPRFVLRGTKGDFAFSCEISFLT